MKFCFVGIETTGLDPDKNSIYEIYALVEIDGEPKGWFNQTMRPFADDLIDLKALEARNKTVEEIKKYDVPSTIHEWFVNFLGKYVDKFQKEDKFFFVAYNAPFVNQFVRNWFNDVEDNFFGSWFWTPPIDMMTIAGWMLMEDRPNISSFKLPTLCDFLGIPVDKKELNQTDYKVDLLRRMFHLLVVDDYIELTEDQKLPF
jgi:DNA polymerase-3 subunit epsilon